jgi:hypothetical protein
LRVCLSALSLSNENEDRDGLFFVRQHSCFQASFVGCKSSGGGRKLHCVAKSRT